ncbi:MAG: DNA topoisomerase [Promethearchaeota archaeon]
MTTIIIAEKSKAAKSIAEALGSVKSIKKSQYVYVYNVPSKDIYVIPLRGHLLEHRNTPEFKNWKNPIPREIITNKKAIKKYQIRGMSPYVKTLQEYAKNSNHCIIGTDADIEGCNIGIIDALPYVKKVNPKIKVSQLWLSTLQKSEIQNKYKNLVDPKYSWAETGEARAILDAIIGFSATREVTNSLQPALLKFKVNWTSIGRVQTSSLYLLYLREKEIKEFVPEKYFTIDATLIAENDTFRAHHKLNPFNKKDEEKARKIYEKIKNEKIAIIENFNQNLVKRKPPTPLNTNKALVLLTKNLKISAKKAMDTMNSLYLNKIISYPRTDSDVYKSDFDHLQFLNEFTKHSLYGNYTRKLLNEKRTIPTKGKKDAGDHPPITPIESLELSNNRFENAIERKAYDLLARHYLALFGKEATESKQDLDLLIKDEPFIAQIVSLVDEGFFEIAPFLKPKYDIEIEIKGDTIPVKEIEIQEKETRPPPRYNDTTLLKLMEKHGLGTKATRPTIIQIMEKRKVIFKEKEGKKSRFHCSDLGIFLIESLMKVWLPFLEPEFTKWIEKNLEDIKDEKREMEGVVGEIKKKFLDLFDKFISKRDEFVKTAREYEIKNDGRFPLTEGKCPKCQSQPMKFINLKGKRFLVCSDDNCKTYLPLPKKGTITMLKTTCSLCGMNAFKISTRKSNKTYTYHLCPKCWKEGLDDKTGEGFCSNCKKYKISRGKCVEK